MKKPVVTNKPLTRKQSAFVKHLIENPKDSATKAVLATYNIANPRTASAVASENLTKPSIVSELAKYNNLVENTIINTVNEYANSDDIKQRTLAVDTAKYVHDKIHGRATQKVESNSTHLSLQIDLSGDTTEVIEG